MQIKIVKQSARVNITKNDLMLWFEGNPKLKNPLIKETMKKLMAKDKRDVEAIIELAIKKVEKTILKNLTEYDARGNK